MSQKFNRGDKVKIREGALPPNVDHSGALRFYGPTEKEMYDGIYTLGNFEQIKFPCWQLIKNEGVATWVWKVEDLIPYVEEWIPKIGDKVVPFQRTNDGYSSWEDIKRDDMEFKEMGYFFIDEIHGNEYYLVSKLGGSYWRFNKEDFKQYLEQDNKTTMQSHVEIRGKKHLLDAFIVDLDPEVPCKYSNGRTYGLGVGSPFIMVGLNDEKKPEYYRTSGDGYRTNVFKLPEDYNKALEAVKEWKKALVPPKPISKEMLTGSPTRLIVITKDEAKIKGTSWGFRKKDVEAVYDLFNTRRISAVDVTAKRIQIGCEDDGLSVTKDEINKVLEIMNDLN